MKRLLHNAPIVNLSWLGIQCLQQESEVFVVMDGFYEQTAILNQCKLKEVKKALDGRFRSAQETLNALAVIRRKEFLSIMFNQPSKYFRYYFKEIVEILCSENLKTSNNLLKESSQENSTELDFSDLPNEIQHNLLILSSVASSQPDHSNATNKKRSKANLSPSFESNFLNNSDEYSETPTRHVFLSFLNFSSVYLLYFVCKIAINCSVTSAHEIYLESWFFELQSSQWVFRNQIGTIS